MRKINQKVIDRILAVIAILTIFIAWFVGAAHNTAGIEPFLTQVIPDANQFKPIHGDTFAAYSNGTLIGYVTTGQANGYGGPLQVAVGVDLQGNVLGLTIINSKESISWQKKIEDKHYPESLIGKSYTNAFVVGQDVDGITGATYTSQAIAQAVMQGSRKIAGNQLGLELPASSKPPIQFGLPEITLIALFALGYFGHQRKFKYTKQARWISMLVGLIVLGFMYNRPLTIAYINKFILGFWPEWQTHLYWYLLLIGILFVFTVDNKNPYCQWFCPFGAAQECLGAIGGAKTHSTPRYSFFFKWLQRGLAWLAIILALIYRNPGLTTYEVFGVLFKLTGSVTQFILLGIILIASLFIKRPWCKYLCPLRPVDEFIRLIRAWTLELWKKRRNSTTK